MFVTRRCGANFGLITSHLSQPLSKLVYAHSLYVNTDLVIVHSV